MYTIHKISFHFLWGVIWRNDAQTVLMMFISVALEALVSPNDLMLNAPSSSESERRSRAKSRPATHTERILSWTVKKTKQNKTKKIAAFLKCQNLTSVSNRIHSRLQIDAINYAQGLWTPRCESERPMQHLEPCNTWAVAFPVWEAFISPQVSSSLCVYSFGFFLIIRLLKSFKQRKKLKLNYSGSSQWCLVTYR